MGPWLSRKRAQGKGKAIKMPHTLLPQRKQIKMNAAGLPPEEAKVPKARGVGGDWEQEDLPKAPGSQQGS